MAIATAAISATELLVKQWHLFLAPTLVYAAVWILQNFVLKKDHLSNIPFAGAGLGDESKRRAVFLTDAKSIYLEGYNKFKRGIYRITTLKSMDKKLPSPADVVLTYLLGLCSRLSCCRPRPSVPERTEGFTG